MGELAKQGVGGVVDKAQQVAASPAGKAQPKQVCLYSDEEDGDGMGG